MPKEIVEFPPFIKDSHSNFEELYRFYIKLGENMFASDLGISPERLHKIIRMEEPITPGLARKLRYLWQIRLGTTKVKVPIPFLKPGIRECRTITCLSGLAHGDLVYMAINHRDVLTDYVEIETYDDSIVPIRDYLDDWVATFFRRKDKAMELVKSAGFSVSTHYEQDCPDSRRYEFEFMDNDTEEMRYELIYTKGQIIKKKGNLPFEEIVSILKKIGRWEK
jgi:hypothetical protein